MKTSRPAAPAAGRRCIVGGRHYRGHADQVHRISTEIIQLRDGELETAVISRELGLAVRVTSRARGDSPPMLKVGT